VSAAVCQLCEGGGRPGEISHAQQQIPQSEQQAHSDVLYGCFGGVAIVVIVVDRNESRYSYLSSELRRSRRDVTDAASPSFTRRVSHPVYTPKISAERADLSVHRERGCGRFFERAESSRPNPPGDRRPAPSSSKSKRRQKRDVCRVVHLIAGSSTLYDDPIGCQGHVDQDRRVGSRGGH